MVAVRCPIKDNLLIICWIIASHTFNASLLLLLLEEQVFLFEATSHHIQLYIAANNVYFILEYQKVFNDIDYSIKLLWKTNFSFGCSKTWNLPPKL